MLYICADNKSLKNVTAKMDYNQNYGQNYGGGYPQPGYAYQRQVGFGEAITRGFKNYTNFSGRASRSEYWWWVLLNFVLGFIPVVNIIYGLAALIPSIAVGVRRLHDTGRSGWWLLLALIPLVNLVLIYFLVQPSQETPNEYGPVPNMD